MILWSVVNFYTYVYWSASIFLFIPMLISFVLFYAHNGFSSLNYFILITFLLKVILALLAIPFHSSLLQFRLLQPRQFICCPIFLAKQFLFVTENKLTYGKIIGVCNFGYFAFIIVQMQFINCIYFEQFYLPSFVLEIWQVIVVFYAFFYRTVKGNPYFANYYDSSSVDREVLPLVENET